MKKGLNAWAFPPRVKVRDALKYAKRAGYDSIELNLDEKGEIGLRTRAASLKKIAAAAKRASVEISSGRQRTSGGSDWSG